MNVGAVLSWPARTLLSLMIIRARDGHDTFDSEQQNDPVSSEHALFNDAIHYWNDLPDGLVYFASCDPSLGKSGRRSDPSAILPMADHDDGPDAFHMLWEIARKRSQIYEFESIGSNYSIDSDDDNAWFNR